MGQQIKDLLDVKTRLAAEYEDWAEHYKYPVDYDKLDDLLDGMLDEIKIVLLDIRDLPEEDYTQN